MLGEEGGQWADPATLHTSLRHTVSLQYNKMAAPNGNYSGKKDDF